MKINATPLVKIGIPQILIQQKICPFHGINKWYTIENRNNKNSHTDSPPLPPPQVYMVTLTHHRLLKFDLLCGFSEYADRLPLKCNCKTNN